MRDDDNDDIANEGSTVSDVHPPPDPTEERKNEYTVEIIVGHKKNKDGIYYHMLWYGYDPTSDTLEPASHIPWHFIDHYSNKDTGNKKGNKFVERKSNNTNMQKEQ